MSDRVTCRVADGVADVRLNRPEKINALDYEMFAAIGEVGDQVAADRSVRAVVLSGEGRGFCAGLDFTIFAGDGASGGDGASMVRRVEGRIDNAAQHTAWVWHELDVPVIAAIHGVALGGGLQIALGADVRLVAPDARLSVLEIRWGLIPDMTGTWTLPRLVGVDVAKELTWTGRMVSGEEAVALGLATRVSEDPRADALALAAQIAANSPAAVRAAKALLSDSGGRDAARQLREEERLQLAMLAGADQAEAVAAYLEQRPPRFADP